MKRSITLQLTQQPQLPLEAEQLRPDLLEALSLAEILALPLLYGNQTVAAGAFFEGTVAEESGEGICLTLQGDLSRVKRLGQGMQAGELIIEGPAGFHTGAGMAGGTLTVRGDAGDWLGAQMTGGLIRVEGNAGHWPGGAYRGMLQGMKGGAILIQGQAGQMAGTKMRGGLIAIAGDCGDSLGYAMNAGTILVSGQAGRHVGSEMLRGTIILLQPQSLLPVFYHNCDYRPAFWPILWRRLQELGFTLPATTREALFARYSGDALTGGKGEVLLCQTRN